MKRATLSLKLTGAGQQAAPVALPSPSPVTVVRRKTLVRAVGEGHGAAARPEGTP